MATVRGNVVRAPTSLRLEALKLINRFGGRTAKLLYSSRAMNRSTLIELLATRFPHLTQQDASSAIATILDAMNDAMARGHRIEVRGFGSFSVTHRAPRMGRNPRSGESVQIPERRVPRFKMGKALRAEVDQRTAAMAQLRS